MKLFFSFFPQLFIYFWLHWVLAAALGLSLVVASVGYSLSWCSSLLLWFLLLRNTGSGCAGFSSCARRLSSCGDGLSYSGAGGIFPN